MTWFAQYVALLVEHPVATVVSSVMVLIFLELIVKGVIYTIHGHSTGK